MILKTVKTAAETGVAGIQFITVDKQITEVVIGSLRIRKGGHYQRSLEVLIEAPFDCEERFRVTGKIVGFPDAISYHSSKYEAETAGSKLEDIGATFAIEQVNVLIDASGNIAGEGGDPAKPSTADVPF